MTRKIICVITLACYLLTFNGCATIIAGKTQNLPVSTMPSGAIVTIGTQKQMTPATFILDKSQSYVVRIEKEGYQPMEITLRKGISGWVFGNVIFGIIGGVIGLVIDMSTGSATKFVPTEIEATLIKEQYGLKDIDGKTVLIVKLVESAKDTQINQ